MKLPWQRTTWDASIKANVALSFALAGMTLIALMAVNHAFNQHERIVLTPTVIDKKMTLGWESADEDYIKEFGLGVAVMVGNLTPENARFIVDSMSLFIHSSIYPDLRKKILAVADMRQFREVAAATRYLPSGVYFEADSGKVFVSGVMEVSTSTGKEKRPMTYEMLVRIEGGRPMIYSFDNYAGEAHSKEWGEMHPAKPENAENGSIQK